MDKLNSFEKYKAEDFYHSDRRTDVGDIKDWDLHYFPDGHNLSGAELAKTVEMMSLLRDETRDLAEDETAISFSDFRRSRASLLENGGVITIRHLEDPEYALQVFKGGSEDGKVKVIERNKENSEKELIIQPDGNFHIFMQSKGKDGNYTSEAFSTRPRDRAIGFERMTVGSTKTAVGLVNRFIKNVLQSHKTTPPFKN